MRASLGRWIGAIAALVASLGTSPTLVAQAVVTAARPAIPAARAYAFPPVLSRTLSNGIPVAIVENHEMPVVSIRVVIDSGPFVDPPGKSGLFSLMLAMLGEGTTTRTADQLADRFAEMGSTVTSGPTLGFTTLTRNVEESVTLLADMVANPSFPVQALTRLRAARLATVRAAQHSSNLIPPQLFRSIAFGTDHPYARHPDSASIAGITRDDLIAIHQSYVRPANISIVVVGDVSPPAIVTRLEREFGGLQRGGVKIDHNVPSAKPPSPTTIYLVDAPADSVYLYTAHVIPPQSSPDVFAIDALNTLLGGVQGTSRLSTELRGTRGFAYITNSTAWQPAPFPATLVTAGIVGPAHADSALIEWMRVLRGFVDHPPSGEEMTFARENRTGNIPIRLQTDEAMARQIGDLFARGLPLAFMARYGEGMARVTATDVLDAARKYLDPDHLIIIVVGPRAKIEARLRAANIAPVVVVDRNGTPVG